MGYPSPRKHPGLYNAIDARNPLGATGTVKAFVRKAMLHRIGRASVARINNLTHVVPAALKNPQAIFRGEDGAFAYVYVPGTVYYDEVHGHARNAHADELFVVSLDANLVLLDWFLVRDKAVNRDFPDGFTLEGMRRLL